MNHSGQAKGVGERSRSIGPPRPTATRLLPPASRLWRVEVATLAEELAVTAETVRRDLTALERRGLLRRMAGWLFVGAIAALPALPQLAAIFSRRESLMFAQRPDMAALLNGAVPVPAVVSVLVGMSLALVWGGRYAPNAPHAHPGLDGARESA